jgi:hypothetical protein
VTPKAIIAATRHWVETVVIDLNLCPFAKRELVRDRIRFVCTDAVDEQSLLMALQDELLHLQDNEPLETTLLVHPQVLADFDDYNQFLDLADMLLGELRLTGEFQIASFHPDYQFAGTEPEDVGNTTNRSPYPMLHLIRERSLAQAIENYPDPENIPARNVETVERLGPEAMQALLEACFERGRQV